MFPFRWRVSRSVAALDTESDYFGMKMLFDELLKGRDTSKTLLRSVNTRISLMRRFV